MGFYQATVSGSPEPQGVTNHPRSAFAARQLLARIHTGVSSQPDETKGREGNPQQREPRYRVITADHRAMAGQPPRLHHV